MQLRNLICIFSFLLSSQHVSALAGHHQVLLFMLKLSNVHQTKKTTPTRWWRTAGANATKTAGRVKHNHNRTTAGRYNINKKGTSGGRLVKGEDFKNKNKNKF
jgi:hypothetical protein